MYKKRYGPPLLHPDPLHSRRSGAHQRFGTLVHGPTYNSDVVRPAPDQLAVFQAPSEAPISELIRVERATRKNSQPATAQRVALKMGRRLSGGGRIGYVSI